MAKREELTDEQWAILEPLIPKVVRRADGRGSPVTHSDRAVLNGILWVLRTIVEALARDLEDRGKIDLSECFIDGTFAVAKKGLCSGKDQAGQGYKDHGYCGRYRYEVSCKS